MHNSGGGKVEINANLVGAIGVVVLLILLFARMWIAFAMILIGFFGFAYLAGFDPALKVLATLPYTVLSNYTLSTLPLFVLMGIVIANTGIGEDLYRTAHTWMGHLRGGLVMATIAACAALAAICGNSMAGTITMGKVAVPEMRKYKYDESMATACVSAGGTLGFLIPPSLGFILYAILTEESVGKLFMAGVVPGVLLTVLMMAIVVIIGRLRPGAMPPGPGTSFKEKIGSLKYTWAMALLFLLVMGGIYGGIFTPTEAGAIGSFGAFVISAIGKRLSLKNFISSLADAIRTTGMVVTIIMGAYIFNRFLAISELPFSLSETVSSLPLNRYAIFAIIILLYIILGMFMDIMPAIVLTVPILVPVVIALGFDTIWYGVIMILVMEMGMITPPIGMNVFILSGVTGSDIGTIFRGVWPFVAVELLCVVILTIFPQIVMFLPNMM